MGEGLFGGERRGRVYKGGRSGRIVGGGVAIIKYLEKNREAKDR